MASRTNAAIDPRTRNILADAQIDGYLLRLPDLLAPDAYAPVKKIFTALEGVWSHSLEAFVFPPGTDLPTQIATVLDSGRIPLAPKNAEGFVRTPPDLGDDLCDYPNTDLRWLPARAHVLEPSAGDGALAAAILRANPEVNVTAVEPNPRRADACAALGSNVEVHTSDFETFATTAIRDGRTFDAIVMNPPFAVPSNKALWIDHLRLAWHLLRPGATLVCLAPNGIGYRNDTAHRDIRTFIDHYGTRRQLPGDVFADSGIHGPAWLIRMVKPLAAGLDHLFAIPDTPPVRVAEPLLTASAVTGAPVQLWWDSWRNRDRILRYRARCVQCGWLLWGFDDGENDPRGVLGDFTSGFSLDAADYTMIGPTVGLCSRCGNDGDLYRKGLDQATRIWATTSDRAPALASARGVDVEGFHQLKFGRVEA